VAKIIILNMMLVVISLLIAGCLENKDTPVAIGTHMKFMNMGPYIISLNLTDNNSYDITDAIIDKDQSRTGPPDSFTISNYTKYSRDTSDKKDDTRKLSLDVRYFDVIRRTDSNLLQQGLSKWAWNGSNPYETYYLRNYRWMTVNGKERNEIDAACWIDDKTMFTLKLFNTTESDSLAILNSIKIESGV
jgi:hypothetical protein